MKEYKCDLKTIEGLKSFQKEVIKTHSILPLQKAISWFEEEVGELKEGIAKNDRENIKEEIGDCLFWCISIANSVGLDISEIIEPHIQKYIRKYPEHYKNQMKLR